MDSDDGIALNLRGGALQSDSMSLITRCPACKTMFKVVPDQLRISEGWVRCGQCSEIFDASKHLQGSEVEASQATPVGLQAAAAKTAVPLDMELGDDQVETESLVQETVSTRAALSREVTHEPIEPVLGGAFLPTQSFGSEPDRRFALPHTEAESAPQELSFMRGAKSTSPWKRTWVRVNLLLASLLLCLALAGQLLVDERDRIAAMEPGLKPWIEEVCSVAECTVAPLKQIESVVIDSSSFNKIRGDVYRLNFSLRNTAPLELAMPAIELSLTDVHDQPVMRRVFQPDELGIRSGILRASSGSSTSLTLAIKTNTGVDRIAGYRILAFYP